jgi:hypothetical protein
MCVEKATLLTTTADPTTIHRFEFVLGGVLADVCVASGAAYIVLP